MFSNSFFQAVTGIARRLATARFVHLLILAAIISYCFGRTLGSYFLADDFGELCYVHRIFHGEPALFWSNFTGNYMQIPSMSVYRPWLLMALVIDYLIWGANAVGFYLSNILYFAGDCVLLYLLMEKLTSGWSQTRSRLAAFFSAALFAAYPLHSESISWVVGRVDVACCFYYLLSLYLLARSKDSRSKGWLIAAVCSFWLAITTKEMAIGLPVLAFAIGLLFPRVDTPRTIASQFKAAIMFSLPFWLSTAVYFVIRLLTLGTLTGGYTGGIGAVQLGSMVQRWTDVDTIKRLLFPLNFSVFHDSGIYPKLLVALYFVLAALFLARVMGRAIPWRWLLLLAIWAATTLAPVYQLWGLGYNLEGSRFVFFLSMVLCAVPAILVFAPQGDDAELSPRFLRRLTFAGAAALALLIFLFARISCFNNIPWVHAGKTVRAVQQQAMLLARGLPAGQKAIVLGIPKDEGGAHMILNGATFAMMLAEPFSRSSYAQSFLTFDPVMFGNADVIDSSRLKEELFAGSVAGCYVWNAAGNRFDATRFDYRVSSPGAAGALISAGAGGDCREPVRSLPGDDLLNGWVPCTATGASFIAKQGVLSIDNPAADDGFTKRVNLDPLDIDFMELTLDLPKAAPGSPVVSVAWNGASCDGMTQPVAVPAAMRSGCTKVLVPLSTYWRWYAAGTVQSLTMRFQHVPSATIKSISFLPASRVAPCLSMKGAARSMRGVYEQVPGSAELTFDGTRVTGAAAVELEVSRPDCFFENRLERAPEAAVMPQRLTRAGLKGAQSLDYFALSTHAYYQIRARCLDRNGAPCGIFSDPVTVKL